MKTKISLLLSTFILTGCVNLSPTYKKPDNTGENNSFINKENEIKISTYKWWEEYNQKELNELLNIMFNENQDIQVAKKQIDLNLENIELDKSYLLPELNLKEELTFSDLNQMKTNKFGINMSSFELDYLGKVKNKIEISRSDLKVSTLNLDYLKMISSYDLVNTYFSICSLNEQIKLTENKVAVLKKINEILNKNVEIGLSPKVILIDKEIELNTEIKNLKTLKIKRNSLEKSLKSIIGKDIEITYVYPKIIELNEKLIVSKQIENRFDVISAEEELKKANAKIGIAKAQYFPTISLSAFLGVKNDTSDIFGPSSNYWTISPSIVFNIFDFGRTSTIVEQQKIQKEQALIKYVKTIRTAFLDVKTNVLNYKETKEYLSLIEKDLILANEKYILEDKKNKIGLTSEIDLLIKENALLTYKIQKEIATNDFVTSQLNLRKSLHGKIN